MGLDLKQYPFDAEEELKDVGMYKAVPKPYGGAAAPVRKFNTPITPNENFKRVCRHEMPLWMMNLNQDFNFIQPMVMPEAWVRLHGIPKKHCREYRIKEGFKMLGRPIVVDE